MNYVFKEMKRRLFVSVSSRRQFLSLPIDEDVSLSMETKRQRLFVDGDEKTMFLCLFFDGDKETITGDELS